MAVLFLGGSVTTLAQFTYSEDFKNSTAAGWVLDPAGNTTPAPILTSGATGRSGDPEGLGNTIDPSGAGWLRLTNDSTNQHNAVYFDTPVPSAGNSVTINFGMNLWGGNNYGGTGADGLTFFLYDASKEFQVGARGGALGYAQMDAVGGTILHDGLDGGWVGIAFDPYGNFSTGGVVNDPSNNITEGKLGGLLTLQPNSVAVRGPGQDMDGYNYLAGTGNRDYTDTGDATTLDAGDGTVPDLPYTMAFATATSRPNQSTQYRNVSITFDENSQLSVSMQFGEDGLWYDVLNVDLSSFVRPEQLKMGFAAGTGGGTLVAEIGGILSVTATAGSGNFVWDNGEGTSFKIWGTSESNPLNWAGNTNPTLKSNVLFNSTFVTAAQNIDVTGSDKVIKNMYFGGTHAYTLTTSDERKLIFDSDSIGVPTSINLTNDVGGNADHTVGLDVLMNKNLEVNNNISALTNTFTISGNIDTNGNGLALKGVGRTVLSGVISGTGTLGKYDSGTTVISGAGANTYTGATTINAGILQIEKNTALGSTAAGTTVNSGGTLALNGTGLAVAEGLTLNGTGSAGQGALHTATGTNTWTGTVALGGDASIGAASGTTLTVSGVVSGADGNDLTKAGSGTLVLSGTNTYTGATNVTAGTLVISNENNLGGSPGSFNAAQLNLDGGTLRTQTSTGTINDTNRGVPVGAAGATFETHSDLVIANAVAGAGALTKTGAGTLTLAGTNTHSGSIAINTGTLAASGGSAIGDTSAVTISSGATFSTAGSSETVGSIAGAGTISLGTGTTALTVGNNGTSTAFSGVISGGANADLVKTGAGTLTLSGTNTFTGNLQLNSGTVALGASNVFNDATSLVLNGGTFATYSGGTGYSDTFNDLKLLSSSSIDYGSLGGVLTFGAADRDAGNLTIYGWAGDISGGGASQLKFNSVPTDFTGSLDQITFDGYGAGAIRLASGEIVPVTGTVYTWNSAGTTWAANANWDSTPDGFPGGTGHTAIFGDAITSNLTLSLAANRTLGYLVFNDDNNVTLQNNNLRFDVSAGSAQLNVNNTGSATISSAVGLNDNLSINQNSTGTLTLSGTITNQSGNNTITVGGSGDTTISGQINTGTGGLTKTGTGTLTLTSADNDYTGRTIINNGVLAISTEDHLGNNPGASVANQLTLDGGTLRTQTSAVTINDANREIFIGNAGGTFDTVTNLTVANTNVISGAGTITKTGSGVLNLSATNTHTGDFVVNAGTLATSGGAAIGNAATVTINGGSSVWQTGAAETVGNIAGDGQIVFSSSNTLTVGSAANSIFTGTIVDNANTGILTKAGTGTLTLGGAGANTYDGATNITVGTLNIQKATALGSTTGNTVVSTGAALELEHGTGLTVGAEALTLAGTGVASSGALRSVTGANSMSGNITLTGTTEIQTESGSSLTLSGGISSGSTQNLVIDGAGNTTLSGVVAATVGTLGKNGDGTLTLANANLYTGATTLNAGTTAITNGAALGTTGAGTTVGSGATLALSGGITVAENLTTFGQGVGSLGAVRNTAGNNTLSGTITLSSETFFGVDSGTTLTSTGAIGGTSGLAKQGDGTLVLDSATANNYDGTTAIAAGTLEVRRSTSLGDFNATTIASGATLKLNGSGLSLNENLTVTGTGVAGAGAIQSTGGNNTLSGAINLTGPSSISSTTGTSLTLSGVVGGDFNLIKDGAGDLTLGNAASTYTGTTTVRNGSLTVTQNAPSGSNGALGNAISIVQLGDAGSTGNVSLLAGGSGGVTVGRQISVNNFGTGTSIGGSNTTGTNTFSGNITLGKEASLTAASGGTVNVSGVISGTGAIAKTGDGTVLLSGANTYGGATTVSAGTLQVTHANALGSTAAGTTVSGTGAALALSGGITLASGESLTLNGTGVSNTGALTNASGDNTVAGTISLASATSIGSQAGSLTLAGVISGTGTLATAGAGNLTLTGSNTFTGATTIGGTGTVTLNGSGSLAATTSLTLNSSSILSLGAGHQINDAANLTLSGGTLLLNGYQDVLANLTLTASTTSTVNYLNESSLLRFTGTGTAGAGSQLTIDNWAGNPTTGGSTNYGLLFNTQAEAIALENNVLFNGWTTLGNNSVIANGSYWEIVPIVTVNEWNITGGGNWDTAGNWTPASEPDSTAAIALLGDSITAGTTASISTSASGTDADTVSKLIIATTGARNYTVVSGNPGTEFLEFNASGGTAQLLVSGDGQHTISTAVRVSTDTVITNDGTATTPLTISGAVDLRNGASSDLTVSGSGTTLISGVISNNTAGATLVKTGSGSLTLSGNNTFSGGTTLRNGSLILNNANATGSAGTIVVNDAGTTGAMNTSLLVGTDGITVAKAITVGSQGATTTLGGATTLTAGTDDVTFSGNISLGKTVALNASGSSLATFSGVLSGAGGLDKIGDGTVRLSGGSANTNTGNVSVFAGTLEITKSVANGAIGDSAAVTVANGATLKFNNGQNETIGSLAGAGTVDNANATAMTLTAGGNNATTTFSGNLTDTGGNLALTKTGTGTLTLSGAGANTYDGATTISAGTVIAAKNTALGNTTGNTTVAVDATLALTGGITIAAGEDLDLAGTAAPNIASLANLSGSNTYAGAVNLSGAAGADVKVDASSGSQLTVSGVVSETGGSKDFVKTGTGTLVLSNANSYTGSTNVAAGTLVVANSTALGAATGAATDDTSVQIGATLAFDHATGVTVGSGESITVNTTANPTIASLKNIAGSNTIQGTVTLAGGVNTGAIFDTNAGTLDIAGITSSSTPANNNFVTKTGSGTLTLSGTAANTFQGAFGVNDGTVLLNKTAGQNATGTGTLNIGDSIGGAASATVRLNASNQINNTSAVNIATDGRLDLQGNSDAIGALTMAGGSVTATGGGTLTLGGNLTFNGIGTNTAAITGNVDLGGNRTLQVGNNGVTGDTDLTINGVISGTGNSFTKTDLGTLRLTGAANTYTGNFQITDGTVVLDKTAVAGVKGNATGVGNASVTIGDSIRGANTAIMQVNGDGLAAGETSDQIANTATLTVNSDGKLLLARSSGTDMFTETVGALAGAGNVDLGYYGLIAGGNNADTTFAGTLAGQSTSLFEKAGSGTLTIDSNLGFGGNLNLTGGTLAFNVDNAFTNVNLSAGTTLRLSDTDLSIANLNLTGSGTITLDFAGSASMLDVTNLNIGAGITLNIINWQNAVDYFFAANWTGAVIDTTGSAPMNQVIFNSPTWSGADTKWQGYDDQITPVPEPSTYGALLLGAMGALLGYRRWRKAKAAKA
ncbi:MAG: autotransporter-associated beta strand repeat-containing protein [Lacunisphaera sp.]|nr:autotransporter-associated beta strand repeat-containing protein [Lacunisphaera sp.]